MPACTWACVRWAEVGEQDGGQRAVGRAVGRRAVGGVLGRQIGDCVCTVAVAGHACRVKHAGTRAEGRAVGWQGG